jgi:serine/threonine-protein kinase
LTDLVEGLRNALSERYAIEREVGRGATATVYLARDVKHDRAVAVKVLHAELAATLGAERFLREIKIAAGLNHPHILPLHDSGEAGGFLFYVMPFVEGESLRDRLRREKQLPVDDALRIAREAADALSYAHAHDVVHRDIKPENILLVAGHAVVADFGLARAISAAGGAKLTQTGLSVGTPMYMSPEQASGSSDVDGRSDLYSLACTLYEMLAGQPPFTGATVESVVRQHMVADPPNITRIRPSVPAEVMAALTRALAKAPADRFNPVALFGEALGRGDATGAHAAQATRRGVSRRTWQIAIAAAATVVVLGALLIPHRGSRRTVVAVLPLENLTTDTAHAYFAGGLQDEILTQLSKVASLTVISRTSVLSYTGKNIPPIKQIAREIHAGTIVEGTVQVVGGRLRVHIQVIDGVKEGHIWSDTYDRTLDDAFAVQSDIAQKVVAAVGAALTTVERRALAAVPTANAEAYRLYVQGREYRTRPGAERKNREIAQHFYERALVLDSSFALAHAALSEVHALTYWIDDQSPARSARVLEEATAALRLAPNLPQAHVAIAMWHYWVQGDYPRALAEQRIALSGLPNDAEVWLRIGLLNRRMGNWNDAVAAHEKTTQLSPRSADYFKELGVIYGWMHRYAEAIAAWDQATSLAPDWLGPAFLKARAYVFWHENLDTLRAAMRLHGWDARTDSSGTALRLLLWERQADSMLQVAKTMARVGAFQASTVFIPASLYAGWAHQLRGDRAAGRGAFDSARVFLDSVLKELPDEAHSRGAVELHLRTVHAARGFALAGLGDRDAALSEARWLQQSVGYREDKFQGALTAEDRALILAQAGDADGALKEIESLLARPSELTVHTLRLDPRWDPIRENPRFKALLTKYAIH